MRTGERDLTERSDYSILIVEDDDATRHVLEEVLRDEGFTITSAGGASAAIQAIAKQAPHLILTDLLMPGADGLNLLAELRSRPEWARIPVLVVSAMPHLERNLAGQNIDGFVSKPFELNELIDKVRELLPAR